MLQQKLFCVLFLIAIPLGNANAGSAKADQPTGAQPTAKAAADSKPSADADAKLGDKDAKVPAATETVQQLVEQLDSADFDKREAACGKLAGKGKEAIPALEKAAAKGDLEVSSRALGVLGKLLKSSDDKTAKAAEESLQRLADGDGPAAARKAKSILDKKNGVTEDIDPFAPRIFGGGPFGRGGLGGRIIINGGTLIIGGGGVAKSRSVSINNGVREIKATDGDKSVKITDDPANSIKIESTDKVNGQDVTKKYEAKDVDDLKKNQPEGYQLYKEYAQRSGNGGGVQMKLPTVPLQPPALPAIPLKPAPAPAAAPAPDGSEQLDRASTRLKIMSSQLDALRQNELLKNAPAEKKTELKKQFDELSKQIDELRKQLDGK
jgi:hypothetical protein